MFVNCFLERGTRRVVTALTSWTLLAALFLPTISRAQTYTVQNMGSIGGWRTYAYAINASGWVTGYSIPPGSQYTRAFLSFGSTLLQLNGTVELGGEGRAVNDHGDVVGAEDLFDTSFYVRALIWRANTDFLLPDLGFRNSNGYQAKALGINNSGRIVGGVAAANNERRAVRWDSGQITFIDGLANTNSEAAGVNGLGQVVGSFTGPDGTVIIDPTTAFGDYPGLVSLYGGTANTSSDRLAQQDLLVSVVPEPSSVVVLFFGLTSCLLAFTRRR